MNISPEHEDIDPEVQPEGDYGASFEPDEELAAVPAMKLKMQKLRDELEKVKAERQEYLDGWQRCKADTINAKKEALAQGERAGNRALESFIEGLIPALDSFDMATGSEAWGTIDKGWRTGMEQVQSQLLSALSLAGVQRFAKIGDSFDHMLHDAIEEQNDVAGESGTIARILRYGYKFGDKIIRPAQVIIKK